MKPVCVRTVKHCLLRNALYGRYISLLAAQQLLGSLGIHIQANRVHCRYDNSIKHLGKDTTCQTPPLSLPLIVFIPISFLFLTLYCQTQLVDIMAMCGKRQLIKSLSDKIAYPNPVRTGQFFWVSTQHSSGNSIPVACSFLLSPD